VLVPGSDSSERLTLHYFREPDTSFMKQNQDARPPDDLTSWPPSIIMDFVYACAALKKWGSPECVTAILQTNQSSYCEDDASHRSWLSRERERQTQERERQVRERADRHERHQQTHGDLSKSSGKTRGRGNSPNGQQGLDMGDIMDWVASLWSGHANRRESPNQLEERCDQGDVKVREWVQSQGEVLSA